MNLIPRRLCAPSEEHHAKSRDYRGRASWPLPVARLLPTLKVHVKWSTMATTELTNVTQGEKNERNKREKKTRKTPNQKKETFARRGTRADNRRNRSRPKHRRKAPTKQHRATPCSFSGRRGKGRKDACAFLSKDQEESTLGRDEWSRTRRGKDS